MPNQEESKTGKPTPDRDRPTADVERYSTDGQSNARGKGAAGGEGRQNYRGDGPGKVGLTSDDQPDLVSPSGVNERDHGAAEDRPAAGGTLDFDDGTDMVHPRGKVTGAGRTWDEKNPSDAGDPGAPNVGMSDRNGPSDPDTKRSRGNE